MLKQIWCRIRTVACLFLRDVREYKKAIVVVAIYIAGMNVLFETSCPLRAFVGIPCPGCGLTRAFFLLMQGDFYGAAKMHIMIYPTVVLIVVFVIRRYILEKSNRFLLLVVCVLLVAMSVYYVKRMVQLYPRVEPMTYGHGGVFFLPHDKK